MFSDDRKQKTSLKQMNFTNIIFIFRISWYILYCPDLPRRHGTSYAQTTNGTSPSGLMPQLCDMTAQLDDVTETASDIDQMHAETDTWLACRWQEEE